MHLGTYVDDLRQRLVTAADAGGEDARQLAQRLTAPLDAAVRLVLLDALSTAAGEISADLAPGSVDVRLRRGEPEFVVAHAAPSAAEPAQPAAVGSRAEEPQTGDADAEAAATTRTTLRLPEHLKARAEVAAARDGLSVNSWLVRAVAAALEQPTDPPPARPGQRGGGTRLTGWVH